MNLKKIVMTLLGINVLQFCLTIGISLFAHDVVKSELMLLIYLALGLTCFNGGVTLVGFFTLNNLKNKSMQDTIKNLETLNSTLRSQRHDYLNHLQVIYGLMELEEYKEAKIYMEPVFKDILKVGKALKTAHPAINALLQAKLQMAEKKQIDFYLEVKSDLKQIPLEPWELCKVLANIIDNGMTALEGQEGEKALHIEVTEDQRVYYFRIDNNGPQISKAQLGKLFQEGFTTKREAGHGIGLSIVRRIVEEAKGSIQVESTIEKTCFEITLPKCVS